MDGWVWPTTTPLPHAPPAGRLESKSTGLDDAGENDGSGGDLGEVLRGMGMSGTAELDMLLEGARTADFEVLGSDEEVAR